MEGNKQGLSYKFKWISNIIKHGLFWHGVRNNMAKIGIDFMPYYYVQEAITPLNEPKLRDDKLQFEILEFGEKAFNLPVTLSSKRAPIFIMTSQ